MRKITNPDDVVARYIAGETCKDIARSISVSETAIYWVLLRRGVQMRPRGVASPLNHDEIVRLYEAGLSTSQIAQQIDIHHTTAWAALRRAGVALRTQSEARKLYLEQRQRKAEAR